jgi:hypothetical protein
MAEAEYDDLNYPLVKRGREALLSKIDRMNGINSIRINIPLSKGGTRGIFFGSFAGPAVEKNLPCPLFKKFYKRGY